MKMLYISFVDIEAKSMLGVKKKILGQIKGFKSNGNLVSYTWCEGGNFVVHQENNKRIPLCSFSNNLTKRLTMYHSSLLAYIKQKKIDTVYIRYALSDIFLLRFLKKLKTFGVKVYLEIPTYPYDKEIKGSKLMIDKLFREKLKLYVDKIVISSCETQSVYGIPVVLMDNGVNVEEIKFVNRSYNHNKKSINLIGVSFIRYTNGYDRLIEGLKNYYLQPVREKDIYITFVGEGSELKNLVDITQKLNLDKYIKFVGQKTGEDLDSYYEKADIAIGSLGDHRVGITNKSPLKSREYCARGIPFISSILDNGFQRNSEFILKVSDNDEPINMNDLTKFYGDLGEINNISEKMRNYSFQKFDWSVQCKKINML